MSASGNGRGDLDLPVKEDQDDPVFRQYEIFKEETKSELFLRIHDLIKSFGNHIAISTYTHAGTDFYRREANSHGALYDDFVPWEYQAAHNVKSALGSWKNKQVSNAAVHFYGYPARHSADARWLTQQRLVQNILYGAGVDFYCIGRLDNLEDRWVLDNVQDVFRFHAQHEKYLHHTLSGNRVLVLRDGQSDREYMGIFEMLTEHHVLFDVMEHWCITNEDVPREIESYEVLILPDVSRLSDEQCKRLDHYVEAGGKLLLTGAPSTKDETGNPLSRIRLVSPGVEPGYESFDKVQGTYFRISPDDKLRLKSDILNELDLVYAWEKGLLCQTTAGAESLLGFIPPAMIGPPEKCYYTEETDIPGLIYNAYGKGKTVFFPFGIASLYHHTRHYGHAELVISALENLLEYETDIQADVSPLIEISRQISPAGDFEWYGLLNHSGQMGNGFQEPLPIRDVSFKFQSDRQLTSIRSLQTGMDLPFEKKGKWVELRLPELGSYDVLLVE